MIDLTLFAKQLTHLLFRECRYIHGQRFRTVSPIALIRFIDPNLIWPIEVA